MNKLLICSFTFPPEQNGVAMSAEDMANFFHSAGWNVEVITKQERKMDISTVFPYSVHIIKGSTGQEQQIELTGFFHQFMPDIIVIHTWSSWLRNKVLQLAEESNIPVVLFSHGFKEHNIRQYLRLIPPFFGIPTFLRKIPFLLSIPRIMRQLSALVSLNFDTSRYKHLDTWLGRKIIPDKLYNIPNSTAPLPSDRENTFRTDNNIPENALLVLNAANFSFGKNQKFLVASLKDKKLPKNMIILMLAPHKNDYAMEVEQLAGTSGQFRFLYGVSREKVEEAITSSDIALLYSRSEQQPIFLLEAMSLGIPWICTDVGCVDEMEGGLIIRRKEKDLYNALMRLYRNAHLRKQLGEQGLQYWKNHFQPEVVHQKWINLLESILSKRENGNSGKI